MCRERDATSTGRRSRSNSSPSRARRTGAPRARRDRHLRRVREGRRPARLREGRVPVRPLSRFGTLSISPQLPEPWLDEYWANLAVAARWLDVLLTPAQLEFDRAKYREVLEHVEQVRGGPGSVLDVGSSLGVFLHLAQGGGWDIAGVEPGAQARARAREHFGLPLSASLAEVRGQTFDLVTFWEVVEHAKDLPGLLAAARELLEPGGTVLTLVGGNAHALANRVMRAASAALTSRACGTSALRATPSCSSRRDSSRRSTRPCSRNSTPR